MNNTESEFSTYNLSKPLLSALEEMDITTPTSIQAKTFSPIMSGKDVVGVAQTGTGKTFAYLLPTLRLWRFSKSPFPQILIMVPTRELVAQVVEEARKLTRYMSFTTVGVYGGTNIRTQKAEVHQGADLVVGTPGRLLDLLLDGVLKTKNLQKLIIDEVDEMFNLGFRTQLFNIVEFLPDKRQNLMFSATLPDEVMDIISRFTEYYDRIEAAPSGAPLSIIEQMAYPADNFLTKVNLLEHLLRSTEDMTKVLIFVSTKKMADALHERLVETIGDQVAVIHSSKSQNYRFASVAAFGTGEVRCLIATDVIARGLDVQGVSQVINFDLTSVPETYIHRIGRTGRATERGQAISFFGTEDAEMREKIETLMEMKIADLAFPEGVEVTEELIPLEKTVEFVPFDTHKMKSHKPSGDAFHEKLDKNKKVNKRRDYIGEMKKKYKKQYKKRKEK